MRLSSIASYFQSIIGKSSSKKFSREQAQNFWQSPWDRNQPADYIGLDDPEKGPLRRERSEFLVSLVKKYVSPDENILELGCNAGRNLDFLFRAGYENLEAIEINKDAISTLKQTFPDMAVKIKIHNSSVEEVIRTFSDGQFSAVFTMAVLEHVHTDSDWIFSEIKRIARKYVISIEDELTTSERHFPRNYAKIYGELGLKEIYTLNKVPGLPRAFRARVFSKS